MREFFIHTENRFKEHPDSKLQFVEHNVFPHVILTSKQ